MLPGGAFTVLLLLISGVSAGTVPLPENVTVSCQNTKVTVSWDYSKLQPPTIFRVNISGTDFHRKNWEESKTADHQFDLSHFVWKSEDNYNDFLYVTVTAVQGGSQSKGVQSNSFSFNIVKPAHTKCSLDFPPVEVKADESGATVSFPNPVYFHKELEQTIKPDSAREFHYTASSVRNGTALKLFDDKCTVEQTTCKHDVQFPEGVEKCVNLTGRLLGSNSVSELVFRGHAKICARDSVEVHHVVILAVLLFCVLVFIITVVVVCICKENAWTMQKSNNPPKALEPYPGQVEQKYYTLPNEDISPVSVQLQKRLSVSSEDSSHSEDVQDSSACSDQRPPARPLYMDRRLSESSNEELEGAGLIPGGSGSVSGSADDSVKTECVSIGSEDEEESVSPYDCPHTVMLDMGDGDMVTGYKG